MALNRLHRLIRLITLLQSGNFRHSHDLQAELGTSRRTLFRDLRMLEAAGIPYYHDPQRGYRIVGNFFLPPVNLTIPETLALLMVGKQMAQQRQRPMAAATLSAICKLISSVPEPIRQACGDLLAHVSVDAGPQAASDREHDHFLLLQRCIEESLECEITYHSRMRDEPDPLRLRLQPYVLHFAARSWYVLGRTDRHAEVRIFKLARIGAVRGLDRRFTRPAFKVADKIGQAWQFIPEGKLHRVELVFSAQVAINAAEVRWHPSQEQEMLPDGRCRMRFVVDGLTEIAWWICGYADQVQVIKPKVLRQRVGRMLAAGAKQYEQTS